MVCPTSILHIRLIKYAIMGQYPIFGVEKPDDLEKMVAACRTGEIAE